MYPDGPKSTMTDWYRHPTPSGKSCIVILPSAHVSSSGIGSPFRSIGLYHRSVVLRHQSSEPSALPRLLLIRASFLSLKSRGLFWSRYLSSPCQDDDAPTSSVTSCKMAISLGISSVIVKATFSAHVPGTLVPLDLLLDPTQWSALRVRPDS